MAEPVVQEWTLDGVLDEMARIDRTMRDRQFAFILGAGASFTSRIPTGKDLAQRWLTDLHLRECSDERPLADWLADDPLGIPGLSLETAAEHYPQVFERRFRGDRESGYAELESVMEGKTPSLGYSLLAEIIQRTRHKVVVTTNFDNLVVDALAMHAHQSPLVVAHESLAGFVRPQLRRPLVAKIHRDLFFSPKNDQAGVSTMEEGWKLALRKLFQYFTPVVVGYGGNDGSLMGLLDSLAPGDIAGRMVWCWREGSPPPPVALAVLAKHQGITVRIRGFDEFMLQLAAKLVEGFDVAAIAERTAQLGQERAERYRKQAEELRASSAKGSPAERKTGEILSRSVQSGKSWWAWSMQADAEPDLDKRDEIFRQGLRQFPNSAELWGNYANFLADQRNDFDAAGAAYQKALVLDPANANNTGNYALFLSQQLKDPDAAEPMYRKALELDPKDANHRGSYASFLAAQRGDLDQAEAMFKSALALDPANVTNAGNYALFLANQRKDFDGAQRWFEKAIEAGPAHAVNIGNYALFLSENRRDYGAAEARYQQALEADPKQVNIVCNYANLLADHLGRPDTAEGLYQQALAIDPRHANTAGSYANFLAYQRHDLKAAEALYKKALELDPQHANNIANYGNFLAIQRQDFDAATALVLRAQALEPGNVNIAANAAYLHLCQGNEAGWQQVLAVVRQVVALSGGLATQSLAEALLYAGLANELLGQPAQPWLARLKGALALSYPRGTWDFGPMFAVCLPKLAPERAALYRAIGAAILDARQVAALAAFEDWAGAPAADPFEPVPAA